MGLYNLYNQTPATDSVEIKTPVEHAVQEINFQSSLLNVIDRYKDDERKGVEIKIASCSEAYQMVQDEMLTLMKTEARNWLRHFRPLSVHTIPFGWSP